MTQIADMLQAFSMHYGGLRYTAGQYAELMGKYSWIERVYKNALYDEVIASHPASLRSLPDVAVIEKAMLSLGRPEIFAPPQIEAPIDAEDRSEVIAKITAAVMHHVEPIPEMADSGEAERQRIRVRVLKGQATECEAFWIRCIDDYGGDWRRAYADLTPTEGAGHGKIKG